MSKHRKSPKPIAKKTQKSSGSVVVGNTSSKRNIKDIIRKKRFWFILLAFIVVALAVTTWYYSQRNSNTSIDPGKTQQISPVKKQSDSTIAISKTQKHGSEVWAVTLLNNAIFNARNNNCAKAQKTVKTVQKERPGDYSQLISIINKECK